LNSGWVTQHEIGVLFQEKTNVEALDFPLGEILLTDTFEGRGYFGFADAGRAEDNNEYSVARRFDIPVFQSMDKTSFTS
jgi:hypothetical protein